MANITINYKKNTIDITKSFEKSASAFGSEAYNELCAARNAFPSYSLVIKANKSSNSFKGMDYNFMKEYISKHENAEKHTEELQELIDKKLSYGEIKQWFVEIYPAFKEYKTRAQWILAA